MFLSKHIANHVRDIPRSGIRDFFEIVQTMADVISLGIGEPDFHTPWRIREAAIYGLERGHTGYTSNLGPVVAALPAPARQTAEGSLAGALGVAHEIGGAQGAAIVDAAKSAWADGLHLSMLIGAGIVLLAAAIAARYLPGKLGGSTDEAIDLDGFVDELDGLSLVGGD